MNEEQIQIVTAWLQRHVLPGDSLNRWASTGRIKFLIERGRRDVVVTRGAVVEAARRLGFRTSKVDRQGNAILSAEWAQ